MLALLWGFVPCAAFAAEAPAIACPALTSEETAALSARLQADLAVRAEDGRVVVTCDPTTAWVAFFPSQGPGRQEVVPLAPGEVLSAERALEAVDRLLSHEPNDENGAPAAVASAEGSATVTSEAATSEAATPTETVVGPDRGATAGDADVFADGRGVYPANVGVQLGSQLELWSGDIAGALGPRAGVYVEVGERLLAFASGGAGFGLETASGLVARTLEVSGGADAYFFERYVAAGAEASVTWLAVESEANGGALRDVEPVGSLRLRARGAFGSELFRVWVGPFVGFRTGPVVVELTDAEIFRVPAVTFGLTLDAGVRLFGLD